jgi:prepilin-type N-terminal cleavage/methylation domain-containing protein
MQRVQQSHGFTLLETVIATAIGSIVLSVLAKVLVASTNSLDYLAKGAAAVQDAHRGLERLKQELRRSAPTRIDIDQAETASAVATFQTAGPYDDGVAWGAEDNQGLWREGWHARYRVFNSDLMRESLDESLLIQGSALLVVRDVDDADPEMKGFSVVRSGRLTTLGLRVRKVHNDGSERTPEFSTAVLLRNSEE